MKSLQKLFLFIPIIFLVILFCRCESNNRFFRPDLPEKLCTISIIDANDTTDYFTPSPDLLESQSTRRYISFEKSFQIEYPEEINDSLREFSFSISSGGEEIFSYQSDSTIKALKDLKIPDRIAFTTGEKYFIVANEKGSSEISAEITVPEPPSDIKLISVNKEITTLPVQPECAILNQQIFHAIIEISFYSNSNRKLFYALLLEGTGANISLPPYLSGLLDFTIRKSNSPGFFAQIHGAKMHHMICVDKRLYLNNTPPPYAYFIDGSKIPDNNCQITLSAQFHDAYSLFDFLTSLRVKLLSIPEELYLFQKSLNTYKNVKDDPFSEPVYLNGNIKGGNGIFAICSSTSLTINLLPPY